jgi:hypothetical protein
MKYFTPSLSAGGSALLFVVAFAHGQHLADTLPPEKISIHSADDVRIKREKLIEYIWGSEGWPNIRNPDEIQINVSDQQYDSLKDSIGNLLSIDAYVVKMKYGFESHIYHFHPKVSNNKVFIYHAGHGRGFRWEDRYPAVIPSLIKQGYSVVAFSMPLNGNNKPMDTIPDIGFVDWSLNTSIGHGQMFNFLPYPFTFFFTPVINILNYLEDEYAYSKIYMTGLSGGGWTVTFLAALDSRINFSFPVAGSTPLNLRVGFEGVGDAEQGHDYNGILGISNYTELYLLGSYGKNRGQLQILNRYDNCCFYGNTRYLSWVDSVKLAIDHLGAGRYNFFLDETHHFHKISPAAVKEMQAFIKYYEGNGSLGIVVSEPKVQYTFPGSSFQYAVKSNGTNSVFQWQVDTRDEMGFRDLISLDVDSLYAGVNTDILKIKNVTKQLHGFRYRCLVNGADDPTTFSYTLILEVENDTVAISDQHICSGDTAAFTIGNIHYDNIIWQVNNTDGFEDIADTLLYEGYNKEDLSLKNVNSSLDLSRYRCIVELASKKIISNEALLEVSTPIQKQPSSVIICPSNEVRFGVEALPESNFQWEVLASSGFMAVTDTAFYSGFLTNQLLVKNASMEHNGDIYRCAITNFCGLNVTDSAKLSVNSLTSIIDQPGDTIVCLGASANFLVNASDANEYEWQINTDQGYAVIIDTVIYSGTDSEVMEIFNADIAADGFNFRCKVKGRCNEVISDSVKLSIRTLPDVEFAGLSSRYCEQAFPIELTGNPDNGVFQGKGITYATSYSPTLAGVGIDTVFYSVTDPFGCSNTIFQVTEIALCADKSTLANLYVYPNPSKEHFSVSFDMVQPEQFTLLLFDAVGRVAYQKEFDSITGYNNYVIEPGEIVEGLYTLVFRTPAGTLQSERVLVRNRN